MTRPSWIMSTMCVVFAANTSVGADWFEGGTAKRSDYCSGSECLHGRRVSGTLLIEVPCRLALLLFPL